MNNNEEQENELKQPEQNELNEIDDRRDRFRDELVDQIKQERELQRELWEF